MHTVILLLGSNLGNRLANLEIAMSLLKDEVGAIVRHSSVYETTPWGFESSDLFLNQAVAVNTTKQPEEILRHIQFIEATLGRKRIKTVYISRTMDIDILFIDQLILETPELTVPHPLIQDRRFVLEPLAEIMPGFIHPKLNQSVAELLIECKDPLMVSLYEYIEQRS
jgi:2-amino-4-hydroxy-6-hydroxymethyldihydropteridine diphosphokinase